MAGDWQPSVYARRAQMKPTSANKSAPRCRVCHSSALRTQSATHTKAEGKTRTLEFTICESCDFCYAAKNKKAYHTETDFGQSARVGDGSRPGREFEMARCGLEILGLPEARVLVYGAGVSRDHELIGKLPGVSVCKATDTDNFQETGAFIPLDAKESFDLVILCEVAEHFVHPRKAFASVLGFVADTGLLVVSTNISDGSDLSKHDYPFARGHVSYYSGQAMVELGRHFGHHCDFRLPACALSLPGPRKRYIFFFRDAAVGARISLHFARVPFAYSEGGAPVKRGGPPKRSMFQRAWRALPKVKRLAKDPIGVFRRLQRRAQELGSGA